MISQKTNMVNWKTYRFFILVFIIIGCSIKVGISQIQLTGITEYEIAKTNILLKNELNIIPLSGEFKKNEIGLVAKEKENIGLLKNQLDKYLPLEMENYESASLVQLERFWKDKKLIILALSLEEYQNNDTVKRMFTNLKSQPDAIKKTILVFFSKEKEEVLFDGISKFPTVIHAKNENVWTSVLVGQGIFGGVSLADISPKNQNQNQRTTRLGYAPPEAVDMDGKYLHHKIDSIAQATIDFGAFPGMQVLVAKSGKVVFHKAYGFHTYQKKTPVSLTDVYDFASLSKITTALPALMKLNGEGKFDVDEPFKTYFPKFKKSNKSELTYREILAHQAGLQPWIPYWKSTVKKNGKFKRRTFKSKSSKRYDVPISDNLYLHRKYKKRMYKAICKSPVSAEKVYKYSGLAFYLFPEIVSELTKTDFETYLKQNIYEPIGATTLTYNPKRFFPLAQIVPTERDTFFRKIQIHGTVHDEGAIMMGGVSANAGLFGSANDLAKLMQMYLNGGTYAGQRIIAESSLQEFTKVQFPENDNRRGLGFDKPLLEYDFAKSSVAQSASPSSYGHSGYTGTFVWVDPAEDLIYIFFSNRVYPTRNNRKIYETNVRPNIHQVIYDAIKK